MAEDQDIRIKCVDCGEEFLFTVGEQSFYREKALTHAPTRCKKCREARKENRGGRERQAGPKSPGGRERGLHAAVCSNCGAETQVPFQPVPGRAVLCRNCFQGRKGAPGGHGTPRGHGGHGAPRAAGGHGTPRAPGGPGGRGAAPRRAPPPPAPGVPPSPGGRTQGSVKWFNGVKGFGFILEDGGEEIFVHFTAIQSGGAKSLSEGDRVEFDIVPGAKGRQAANVVRIG
jgi:CxxC-x17-CxxC domain-containing protein